MSSLTVVIVSHDSSSALRVTLPALTAQLRAGDEAIVVDNASSDGSAALARELGATVLESGSNLGFAAACNSGAEAGSGELLCLLNPDAVPADGWRDAIERPLADDRGWAAWQALVTAEQGETVNTRGGIVHFTGIAWAGGAGEPVAGMQSDNGSGPGAGEPGFVSGACLALPRERYLELGGFPPQFFLYHEDVDLSLRLRLAGGRLGVEHAAKVDHDYEFAKGQQKWRYLERNRWATLIRTYPDALLALLAPALLLTELALLGVAAAGGWLPQKLRAWGETFAWLPRLLGERKRVQATRTVSAGEFARSLTPELDSAFLGPLARARPLRIALRAYWGLVIRLLGG